MVSQIFFVGFRILIILFSSFSIWGENSFSVASDYSLFIVQLWLLCIDMFTLYNPSEFLEWIVEMNAIIIWRYTAVIFALFPTLIYIQMQELSWDVMRFSVPLAQKYI